MMNNMKLEYKGYVLEIEEELTCFKTKCDEPNLSTMTATWKAISLHQRFNRFKWDVDKLLTKKENTMKKLTVEYNNYPLEVAINYSQLSAKGYPYMIGTCESLDSFVKSGYYEDCSAIINEFMKYADHITENNTFSYKNFNLLIFTNELRIDGCSYVGYCKELSYNSKGYNEKSNLIAKFKELVDKHISKEKEFEYKGYTLKLGAIETRKGGYCEELDYKTYGDDEEATITRFKKFINWRISNAKKEDSSHTHLLTQLDRLVQKDKKNNFTPFELRGQLIEIHNLFSKILSLTLEDIYKLYFERAEG